MMCHNRRGKMFSIKPLYAIQPLAFFYIGLFYTLLFCYSGLMRCALLYAVCIDLSNGICEQFWYFFRVGVLSMTINVDGQVKVYPLLFFLKMFQVFKMINKQ